MKRNLLSLFFAAACTSALFSQPLAQELDEIFDEEKWKAARWGVVVEDLDTGEVLYQRDADKLFMPASNMKLYTTAAALTELGADYQYVTHIESVGVMAGDGVLKGSLVVRGSGDPSISGRYLDDVQTTAILETWAKAVKDAGITRIEGAVVGDDNIFDDEPRTGSWQLNYYQEYYSAENSGLAMNDNCWDVMIHPGTKPGAKARLETEHKSRYITFENNVTTIDPIIKDGNENTELAEDEGVRLEIERGLDSNTVTLSGTIALNAKPAKEWGSLHNGTLFTVSMFTEELKRIGIRVDEGPKDIDDLDSAERAKLERGPVKVLHTHKSPPLSRLIAIVNKPSQNFYADMILKTLGAERSGSGTISRGKDAVEDLLTSAGVSDSFQMADGSGLSRQNMVQPNQTIGLLKYMAARPDSQVFKESLPVMGVDGTLRSRLRDTPLQSNVKAKTGTIGGVRSLSGHITTKSGRNLVFSMMANNFTQSTREATEAQDEALKVMYNEGMPDTDNVDQATTETTNSLQ